MVLLRYLQPRNGLPGINMLPGICGLLTVCQQPLQIQVMLALQEWQRMSWLNTWPSQWHDLLSRVWESHSYSTYIHLSEMACNHQQILQRWLKELVVWQSRSYSKHSNNWAGWTARGDAEGWSKGLQIHGRTVKNSESLTDCENRVELLRKVQKAEAKGYNYIGAQQKK